MSKFQINKFHTQINFLNKYSEFMVVDPSCSKHTHTRIFILAVTIDCSSVMSVYLQYKPLESIISYTVEIPVPI
jgi:hypothetical protein